MIYFFTKDVLEREYIELIHYLIEREKKFKVRRNNISFSLMHYLCAYLTIKGREYATKMLKLVFWQNEMTNKRICAVTELL